MTHSGRGDYLGEVGQPVTVTGRVRTATRVNGFTTRSPDRALIVVDVGSAMAKIVTAAAWARRVKRGDQITVTGTVKAHTKWRGLSQTVMTRASRTDPDSPTAPVPWEAVNPAEAGPRPFPRTPNPLAPTEAPAPHPDL